MCDEIRLNKMEAVLIAELLERAAETFSNHGCGDFDLNTYMPELTAEEKTALDLAIHEHNGDPEEHDPKGNHDYQEDWVLMYFFAAKLWGERA